MLWRFKPYLKNYKIAIFFAIVGMVLSGVSAASTAYMIEPILNKIFISKDKSLLYLLPIGIIIIYLLKGMGSFLQVYFSAYVGQDVLRRFRNEIFSNLLSMDIEFFHKHKSGELISRCINDVERIRQVFTNVIPSIIQDMVSIIALLGVVIYQSPKLAFYSLVILPIIIYPILILIKKIKKFSKQSQEKNSNISSFLSEIFSNIELIKSNNASKFEEEKFFEKTLSFQQINLKSIKMQQLVNPIMELVNAFALTAVIIIGGLSIINNELSIGAFFSFSTALFLLYRPIKYSILMFAMLQDGAVASKRCFELLDIKKRDEGMDIDFKITQIEFKNIFFKYKKNYILKNLNLSIKSSQIIAIVGSSGGGKSSIINLLMRFYEPENGEILINGKNIKDYNSHSLRSKIGLVTQRNYIFNDTLANNIAYAREIKNDELLKAINLANAQNIVKKLSLDGEINEFGANLSGGERQKIGIARAIYHNPEILIFDEATSALDSQSESIINQNIQNLKKDKIIFVIAHRFSTYKNADKIAVLNNGNIVSFGTDSELSNSCPEYQKLKNKAMI